MCVSGESGGGRGELGIFRAVRKGKKQKPLWRGGVLTKRKPQKPPGPKKTSEAGLYMGPVRKLRGEGEAGLRPVSQHEQGTKSVAMLIHHK